MKKEAINKLPRKTEIHSFFPNLTKEYDESIKRIVTIINHLCPVNNCKVIYNTINDISILFKGL